MKLLIVEDQKYMAEAIAEILKKHKYIVDVSLDGLEGYYLAKDNQYDLIILDIMLPNMNGYQILEKLRLNKIDTKIIMLTAKQEVENIVKGLNLGADDYLVKPFDTKELLARINAITRREDKLKKSNNTFGDIKLDINNLKLICNNKDLTLTLKEAQLLKLLMDTKNTVDKELIINKLWSLEKVVIDNNVEVYISFLRKKLKFLKSNIKIKTIRGIGYRLEGEEEEDV